MGSSGSDPCLPTLLPPRSGSIESLVVGLSISDGMPPSSQGSNVSLLGVDTQSGISTNPAHPTITQILALVPIFGSNLSGYPQRNFSRRELIK